MAEQGSVERLDLTREEIVAVSGYLPRSSTKEPWPTIMAKIRDALAAVDRGPEPDERPSWEIAREEEARLKAAGWKCVSQEFGERHWTRSDHKGWVAHHVALATLSGPEPEVEAGIPNAEDVRKVEEWVAEHEGAEVDRPYASEGPDVTRQRAWVSSEKLAEMDAGSGVGSAPSGQEEPKFSKAELAQGSPVYREGWQDGYKAAEARERGET